MLKGSRDAVLTRVQPISIHGQLSYDVHYVFTDDVSESPHVARVGPEAMAPGLQVGDVATLDFLVGVVTAVHRTRPAS
jgi:hypothetical protein